MKTYLLAFGFVAILGSAAWSQSPAEKDIYEKLMDKKEQAKAVETVLKKPDEYSALVLYISAPVARQYKGLEEGAFLYYAAQMRARFDNECFTPKEEGADSPFVLYSALSESIGSDINPSIMVEPKAFSKVVTRLKAWSPKAAKDYDPGYEFTKRLTEKEAHAAVLPKRKEFLDGLSDISTLVDDAEYLAALRVVQAFNLTTDDKRPTQAAYDKAEATMKRIEKAKGLKGFFSE